MSSEIVKPRPDREAVALVAARDALLAEAIHMEQDFPGDVPEDCGWWCRLCKAHIDGDRKTGPSSEGHKPDCPIEMIRVALLPSEDGWRPHLDYASEPMREGEFRDPPEWREEREQLRAALRKIKTAATLVTEWLDRINGRDGTALGGPQWFELGRAIAKADEALSDPQEHGEGK